MKYILLSVLLLVFGCHSPKQESEKILNDFFDKLSENGVESAMESLFSTNDWIDYSQQDIQNLKNDLVSKTNQMGQYHGSEHVSTSLINDRLMQSTYLIIYDLQPLKFSFTFYKPTTKWQLQNFQFDSDINDIMNTSSIN